MASNKEKCLCKCPVCGKKFYKSGKQYYKDRLNYIYCRSHEYYRSMREDYGKRENITERKRKKYKKQEGQEGVFLRNGRYFFWINDEVLSKGFRKKKRRKQSM